jgi:hypothetical protein
MGYILLYKRAPGNGRPRKASGCSKEVRGFKVTVFYVIIIAPPRVEIPILQEDQDTRTLIYLRMDDHESSFSRF